MRKAILTVVLTALLTTAIFMSKNLLFDNTGSAGAPPYTQEDLDPPELGKYSWLYNWKRPNGPPKVGLQVGHWKNSELPDELERLRGNTGSSGGGKQNRR